MKKKLVKSEEPTQSSPYKYNSEIHFSADGNHYVGDLTIPTYARMIVIFSHGIGSSRHSVRNHKVAYYLNKRGVATLLVSLETVDQSLFSHGHKIQYLVDHLRAITRWVRHNTLTHTLAIAYFGASTGAAIALAAAAHEKGIVSGVVCRGGRPDLAMEELRRVQIPVLLIVGSNDPEGLELNEWAAAHLGRAGEIMVIEGASHLFEERRKLKEVAFITADWLDKVLKKQEEQPVVMAH